MNFLYKRESWKRDLNGWIRNYIKFSISDQPYLNICFEFTHFYFGFTSFVNKIIYHKLSIYCSICFFTRMLLLFSIFYNYVWKSLRPPMQKKALHVTIKKDRNKILSLNAHDNSVLLFWNHLLGEILPKRA